MKQQFILWVGSIVLTFVIGYTRNVTDEYYPVTGSFGVEGEKVSYKLDKVHYGKEPYRILILTDLKELGGKCILKSDDKWITIPLNRGDNNLNASIPSLKPLSKIDYKVILNYNDEVYVIPAGSKIEISFYGNIPASVNLLNFILLYGGLLFSTRTTLEVFNRKKFIKKYIVFTTSIFIILASIINPLRNSYKLGAINLYVPPIMDIINPFLITLVLMWVVGTVLVFYRRFAAITVVLLLVSTIIIYFNLILV
jgi:hypothetical protein